MRRLYIILVMAVCISIILFVVAFFYIDTHRHTTFFYNIYQNQNIFSTARLDKYNTEDKIVYKSETLTPFHSVYDKHRRNLSINKKGLKVHSYNKKHLSEGVSMNIYIMRVDSSINFLAVGHSNFAYANRLPMNKDFVVFEKDAIISYFNLVDKYDFKLGGLQSIHALTHTYTFLPPHKSDLEVWIHDEEIIEIAGKKIKAVCLKIKLPDKNEIYVWINRWTHIPLLVKEPRSGFKAVYQETQKRITAKRYTRESDEYENREIAFKNKDISLSGTISVPKGEGPFKAVILAWGPGPQDREALGMFTDIADGLARNDTAVLRFDKRGIAKSEGDFSRFTGEDLISDLSCALDFLLKQEEIDKDRIAILGHSEGGYSAAHLAAINPNISACIIMAGVEAVNLPDTDLEMMWDFDKSATNWNEKYMNDISDTAKDTAEILKSGKDWALLLHKRIFLKKCRLDIEKKSSDIIRKLGVPTLILRGGKDTVTLPGHIELLEEALKDGGNDVYEIIYFNRLNHFFGEKVEDGTHRTHLSIDKNVIDTIAKWLNKNLIVAPEPAPEPPAEETASPEEEETPEEGAIELREIEEDPPEENISRKGVL
ncbi:MAG: alpha/beta hydrolase [Candidatus Omnitrophica bacterium]|nr:alpha/beta hydrolase [Candidatus Omnitrophota bacterium]